MSERQNDGKALRFQTQRTEDRQENDWTRVMMSALSLQADE